VKSDIIAEVQAGLSRGLYGARLWVPFTLYICLAFIVFVVQLIAFDNGVSSFISLSECQKTAPY
jgi:hypothetical protein